MRIATMLILGFSSPAAASVLLLTDLAVVELDFPSLTLSHAVATGFSDGVDMDLAPDGTLFISRLSGVGRFDLASATYEQIANGAQIASPAPVISVATGGIDFDEHGRMVVAIHGFPPNGPTRNWYATWDLETQTRTGWLNPTNSFRQISFDVLLRADGTMLSMDYREDRIWSIDRATGASTVLATIDEGVSFLELDERLFVLTRLGEVWRLDESTGDLSFHGQINGLDGNLIGSAVVPAPGGMALGIALACGMLRRRR